MSSWNWDNSGGPPDRTGDRRPINQNKPESRPGVQVSPHGHDRFRPNAQPHPQFNPNRPYNGRPGNANTNTNVKPMSNSSGLGTTGIVFIALGSSIVVIVIILCIVLSCKRSNSRRNIGSTSTNSIQYIVGRGIQRPSFLSFRFSRHTNEPIVVNYPDPDTHLPNYPIQTPYTFESTTSLAQQGHNQQQQQASGDKSSNIQNGKNSVPNQRATIY